MGKKEETKLLVGLWTSVEKPEITLASGERQTVNFAVTVPTGTAPGTYSGYLNFKYKYGPQGGFATTGLTITVNVTGDGGASGTVSPAPTPVKRIKRSGSANSITKSSTSNASAAFSELAKTNNAQRSSDVLAINDAIHSYEIDNRGKLPIEIHSSPTTIGSDIVQAEICRELMPTYIASMPFDPTAPGAHFTDCSDYNTGYKVSESAGKVTVSAPNAEMSEIIQITR